MRIPADEWDAVKRQAETEGVTATDVVRRAIRAYLRVAAVVVAVALVAGCGTQAYTSEPTPTPSPSVTAQPAAAERITAGGAPISCLSAARIAPPAWAGVKLTSSVAASIGRQFIALTDDCLAGRSQGGSAPIACLKAAQTLGEFQHRTRPIADLDAQYKAQWRACVSG